MMTIFGDHKFYNQIFKYINHEMCLKCEPHLFEEKTITYRIKNEIQVCHKKL